MQRALVIVGVGRLEPPSMYLLNVEHEALKVLGRQGLSRLAPGEELIDLGPLLELAHE
jgi:hypothetical protein